MQEEQFYAIDLGTQFIRAGACGEENPELVLFNGTLDGETPCWTMGSQPIVSAAQNMEWWMDVLPRSQNMTCSIDNLCGQMNEEVMQKVLETMFQKAQFTEMSASCMFGVSNANVARVPGLSELMFELFESSSMSCYTQFEALAYSLGRSCACMLNFGAGSIEASTLIDYQKCSPVVYSSVMGTRHYSSMFLQALKKDKEKLRYLDINDSIHLQCIDCWRSSIQNRTNESNIFRLPDGSQITLDRDNSIDAELLKLPLKLMFEGDVVKNYCSATEDMSTVIDMLDQAIQVVPIDQKKFQSHVYCYGDVSGALCKDIQNRTNATQTVQSIPGQFFAHFVGLSILGSLSTVKTSFYTKQSYLEFGPYQPFSNHMHNYFSTN